MHSNSVWCCMYKIARYRGNSMRYSSCIPRARELHLDWSPPPPTQLEKKSEKNYGQVPNEFSAWKTAVLGTPSVWEVSRKECVEMACQKTSGHTHLLRPSVGEESTSTIRLSTELELRKTCCPILDLPRMGTPFLSLPLVYSPTSMRPGPLMTTDGFALAAAG